jgi:hypothetical protein
MINTKTAVWAFASVFTVSQASVVYHIDISMMTMVKAKQIWQFDQISADNS